MICICFFPGMTKETYINAVLSGIEQAKVASPNIIVR